MNWRGRPLTSHEVIVNTIAATNTAPGCACAPNSILAPMTPGPGSATGRWRLCR